MEAGPAERLRLPGRSTSRAPARSRWAFQFLSPQDRHEGRVVMTPEMLNLQWNTVSLYPAGYYARRINTEPSVTLPAGWQARRPWKRLRGTATRPTSSRSTTTTWSFRRFWPAGTSSAWTWTRGVVSRSLGSDGRRRQVDRDQTRQLKRRIGAGAADLSALRLAPLQPLRLPGPVSDKRSGIGLEHHRSSEDGSRRTSSPSGRSTRGSRDLLPHEFTHSWNGSFGAARPGTPNYNVPMRDTLLWVYEGQTQFWGDVMAARAGLWTGRAGS